MATPSSNEVVTLDYSNVDPTTFSEKDVRTLVPILLGPKGLPIKTHKTILKVYKNCLKGEFNMYSPLIVIWTKYSPLTLGAYLTL